MYASLTGFRILHMSVCGIITDRTDSVSERPEEIFHFNQIGHNSIK